MDINLQFSEEFNDIDIEDYDYDENDRFEDVIVPGDNAFQDDSDTDEEPESDAEDQGYPESLSWSDIDSLPSLNSPISENEDDGFFQW